MASFKEHLSTGVVCSILGVAIFQRTFGFIESRLDILLVMLTLILGSILPDIDDPKSTPARLIYGALSMLLVAFMVDSNLERSLESWCCWMAALDRSLLLSKVSFISCLGLLLLLINRYLPRLIGCLTYHRGIIHSIPMAICLGLLLTKFLKLLGYPSQLATLLGYALFWGFIWHLILDELYSIAFSSGKISFKSSSGTALTLFHLSERYAYAALYLLIICLRHRFIKL